MPIGLDVNSFHPFQHTLTSIIFILIVGHILLPPPPFYGQTEAQNDLPKVTQLTNNKQVDR